MKQPEFQQRVGYFPQAPQEEPPKPSKPPRKRKKRRRRRAHTRLFWLGMLVCAAVFVTCAALLINYYANIASSKKVAEQLTDLYEQSEQQATATPAPTATATPAPTAVPTAARAAAQPSTPTPTPSAQELWPTEYEGNRAMRVSSSFYELQKQNKDIVAYLKIDGVLSECVVQRDNSYYLTHNALGQQSLTGALFLDESCDLKKVPTQFVVHGHNMKEGAMFGALKKYKVKDASFYRAHPFIEFNTVYENGTYVIFAVCEVDIRAGKSDYLPFWSYSRFSDTEAFTSYVKKAESLSHYRCNVDVEPGDRLLTLSTCVGEDSNKRLIVMARKLRAGEDTFTLNLAIMSTDDK